jgi:hypothetical protein
MRSFLLALAALATFGLVAPVATPAAAEEKVIVKEHRDHPGYSHRVFGRYFHRDHDHKTVIIKKHY